MCDVRIAADTAVFAESFVKLGLVPGDGGAWLLPRVIGMARASLMTLTGETIDAARALDCGLVTEVVQGDRTIGGAMEVAEIGRGACRDEARQGGVVTDGAVAVKKKT